MPNINLEDWLLTEEDMPPPQGDPNVANMPPQQMAPEPQQEPEDVHSDPQLPDMPEEKPHELDFEQWKKEYFELSIKGDVQEMKQSLLEIRDRKLDPYQKRFIADNLQIMQLRENSNIEKATKELKKLIKEDLDHTSIGSSLVDHLNNVLSADPMLSSIFIKLEGLFGAKADPHRKYLAALLSAVQVGSGGNEEDMVHLAKDFKLRVSARINARFGDINIGNWTLGTDDPQRYLKPPEMQRLEDGSPEEKDVLRRRVEMESIAEAFKARAFIINVVAEDGTIYFVGFDIGTALKSGYTDGKLLFKNKQGDGTEAMIDADGSIVTLVDLKVVFMKETGEMNEDGKPATREMDFIEQRRGTLFLTSQLHTLKDAAATFPGLIVKEIPYNGNPSDLVVLQRCVPTTSDMLLRTCT